MAENFKPITLPTSVNPSGAMTFRASIIPSPKLKEAAIPHLSPTSPAGAPKTAQASLQPPAEPKISLEREGDRITLIRIQCSCGQCLEVQCIY